MPVIRTCSASIPTEIGTGVPDAIRAKLGQGVWVRVIGEFDGTYAGQPWGLGAISQVMDIAEARPDVSPVAAAAAAPRVAAARPAEPPGEVQVSAPLTPDPPKAAARTGDASVATAAPTPLSDGAAAH